MLDIKPLLLTALALTLHSLQGRASTADSLDHTSWSVDCADRDLISIDERGLVTIEITSNQIYILASLRQVATTNYQTVFIRPADLGRGGLSLDWKTVSTSQPVATLIIDDDERLHVKWTGFKNDVKEKLTEFPDPDFYKGAEVTMTKCSGSTAHSQAVTQSPVHSQITLGRSRQPE